MREYVFRGKRIDTKEWVYGGIVTDDPKGVQIVRWNSFGLGYLETYVVDPDTVGQFTGRPDKNGVKIFDGDILQFGEKRLVVWWNEEAFQWQAKERKEVTCTYNGASTRGIFDNIDLGWIYAEIPCLGKMSTEIIGNIHDNPELLEEVSDNG